MAKTTTTDTKVPATPAAKKSAVKKTTAIKSAATKTATTKVSPAKTAPSRAQAKPAAKPPSSTQPATGSTSRKAATAPAAAAAIAAAPRVEPVVVTETRGGGSGNEMKKRDLVDRIAAHGKLKKSQIKPVVDAMLAVLGQALADGQELNLPPLGKMKVNRQKTTAGGQVILIKLRTGTGSGPDAAAEKSRKAEATEDPEIAAKTTDETLAEPAE